MDFPLFQNRRRKKIDSIIREGGILVCTREFLSQSEDKSCHTTVLRPCSHYTRSIIGAPRKPYRIGLLFTFDPACPAQFLWRLRAGTLRFQKWYVPYRIAFWNPPLLMWTTCSAVGPVFGTESHYHSLGLEGTFAFARPKQISIRYCVNSSTPDRSGPVRFPQALFTLYRIDSRTGPRIDPV